jgi:galactitol-specific phosphotransferase system IIB component
MSSIPTASNIQSVVAEEIPQAELSAVMNSLKFYNLTDLFRVIKAATTESEKKFKEELKNKGKKAPRKSSGDKKGVMPPHLKKPSAWFNYVLEYARKHGWNSYTVQQTHKDKNTGEKVTVDVVMPGSALYNSEHVFKDSISDEAPNGKKFIQKDAMSLSKVWWSKGVGAHEDRYREFERQYDGGNEKPTVPEAVAAPVAAAAAAAPSAKVVNKKQKKAEL